MVVDPVAVKKVVPGGGFHVLAPVLVPVDVGLVPEDSRSSFAHVGHGKEGADVEADAVVEVGVPSDGLLIQGLPPHEDVVGSLAFEDQLQALLQPFGGGEAFFRSVRSRFHFLFLTVDPVAQVGVDQGFHLFSVEPVIVDQDREAVPQSVPDMPNERTVLEEPAVLGEELFPQPSFQGFAGVVGIFQQLGQDVAGPGVAVGGGKQVQQPVGGREFTPHGRNADDTVAVRTGQQGFTPVHPLPLHVGQFHLPVKLGGPAISQEAGDGDLQHGVAGPQGSVGGPLGSIVPQDGAAWMAVEDPLGGVVGIGFREAVGVFFGGDF
ncbi:hypothetical protein SDC9_50278 [bioreactor metagenome]|uniref:Uncharacterized protein n=1 Tax=bioreactor metagenome TaxID=1076179 RepID=A0A644WKC8_9ZZZZ